MKGICLQALKAGNDLLLVPRRIKEEVEAVLAAVKKGELTAIIGPDGAGENHLYAAYSGIDGSYKRKAVRIGAGQRQRGANNPAPHFLYAAKIWPL